MKHFNMCKGEKNDFCAGPPTPVSFNLVLAFAAKLVTLANHQQLRVSMFPIAFLHAEMRDEVDIKLGADTLRMLREENLPNLQPSDDEGFYKVDKAGYGYQGSPRYWKDAVAEAAKDLGLKPSKIDNSLYMDPGNFILYVRVDDELLSGDDQVVCDIVRMLQQKFLRRTWIIWPRLETKFRSWVGQWKEQKWDTDSSRRVDTLIKVSRTWTWRSASL